MAANTAKTKTVTAAVHMTGMWSGADDPRGAAVTRGAAGVVMVTITFTPPTTGPPQLTELVLVAAALQ